MIVEEDVVTKWQFRIDTYNDLIAIEVNPPAGEVFRNKFILRVGYFEKSYKKTKSYVKTLMHAPNEEYYFVASKVFYNAYVRGYHYEVDFDQRTIDPFPYLKKGDRSRIIRDATGHNGYIYGLDNKPVLCGIAFDQHYTVFNSDKWNLKKVKAWIEEQPNISNVKIVDIPYWEDYEMAKQRLTFTVMPTPEEWETIGKFNVIFDRIRFYSDTLMQACPAECRCDTQA